MEHAEIINNRLCVVVSGRATMALGICGFKSGLKQIENSNLELKQSTKDRAQVYRDGIKLWANQ